MPKSTEGDKKASTGASNKKESQKWLEKAKKLKALGVIDYDLRKKLTRGQKWWVSTLSNRLAQVIKTPQDFKAIKVDEKDVNTKKVMRADYVGAKNKFFVHKGVYTDVKLNKPSHGDITQDPAAFFSELFNSPYITRSSPTKIEHHFLIPGMMLADAINTAIGKYGNLQTPGWSWTFAFKGCNPFSRVRASLSGAANYLQQMMQGRHLHIKSKDAARELQGLISGIVLIARKTADAPPTPKIRRGKD